MVKKSNGTGRNLVVFAAAAALVLGMAGCSGEVQRSPDLPKGLPEAVKVLDGKVSNAVSNKDQWSFMLEVKSEDEQRAALKELEDSGYKKADEQKVGGRTTIALKKTDSNATIVFDKANGKYVVIYNVVSTK